MLQCWIRRASKEGLNNKDERKTLGEIIFYLTCLPFINPSGIKENFGKIRGIYDNISDKLFRFFEYLERNWINCSKAQGFRISDWNYFHNIEGMNEMKVTNNAAEAHFKTLNMLLKDVNYFFFLVLS